MAHEAWREDLGKAFARFDSDNNGRIDRGEFDQLLDALGSQMSEGDRDLGFRMIDKNEDNTIAFAELAAWWDVVREEGRDST